MDHIHIKSADRSGKAVLKAEILESNSIENCNRTGRQHNRNGRLFGNRSVKHNKRRKNDQRIKFEDLRKCLKNNSNLFRCSCCRKISAKCKAYDRVNNAADNKSGTCCPEHMLNMIIKLSACRNRGKVCCIRQR